MKFRAWDKENNEMLYPDDTDKILFEINEYGITTYDVRYLDEYGSFAAELDSVVMQSTGLFDKNGVEIYDKDIVRDSYEDVFLIEWLESCFILTESYGDYDHSFLDDLSFYEVVGNQFEHPRLLEEE